jgi:hypothetical protein
MPLRVSLILALLVALALPASASAGKRTKHLWATVNVCDTKRSPDTIGIRARMPGNGTRQRMWMRFRTQFYSTRDYAWRYVDGGTSRWLELGSALFLFKETGYSFEIQPAPKPGQSFLLRGVVQYQWKTKKGKTRRRTRKYTAGGHRTRGAEPRGFSRARCRIENPAPATNEKPVYVAPKLAVPQP